MKGALFRKPFVIVAGILLLALILRVLALLSLNQTPYSQFMLWDEKVFHLIAQKIEYGSYHSKSVYEFSPLPIYIMAGIYKLFSPNIQFIRLLNISLGVLTCLNIYFITSRLENRKAGYLACLISAFYQPFILYSIVPLKTSFSIFLISLLVLFFLRSNRNSSFINLSITGLIAGLCINVRPNVIVLIPIIPLIIIWCNSKSSFSLKHLLVILITYAAGFIVAISPFVIRNMATTGSLSVTTTQLGQNLYCGNNPNNSDPYFRPLAFAESSPLVQGIQFTIEASRREGRRLSHSESSQYWIKEVASFAINKPDIFLNKMFKKFLAVFNRFESPDHYDIDFLKQFVTFFKVPLLGFWIIMPLGMVGFVTFFRRSRIHAGIIILSILYASTLVLFYTNARLRLPLLVLLIQ